MKKTFLLLAAAALLGACSTISSIPARHDLAAKIAAKAGMAERVMPSGNFNLTTWSRLTRADLPVNVYIEGDGLAWLNTRTPSLNPTPPDPVGLRLAAVDPAENVVYFARPCQYSGWNGQGACPDMYWTNGRTAPDVIAAYGQALDQLKIQYHVTSFNLIGYSGGGAVAALVAAGRSDVASLRTVAGNIDYAAFTALHNVSPLDASQDPVQVAPQLAHLPQFHFVGAQDTVVTPAIVEAWKKASGDTACIQSTVVDGIAHDASWQGKWQQLLQMPLPCATAPAAVAAPATVPAAATSVTAPAAAAPAAPATAVPAPAPAAPAAPSAAPAAPAPATPAPATGAPPLGTL